MSLRISKSEAELAEEREEMRATLKQVSETRHDAITGQPPVNCTSPKALARML